MATQEEMALEIAKSAAGSMGKESVNKLASVIGGVFPFFGLKHEAVSTYVEDIQKSNLPPEAKMMAIANAKKTYKQLKNQMAIAEIAQKAAQDGTDFSQQSGVDDEWLERFMDSAGFVSDEEVQLLWGNILAKEFEDPNSTPPSVIRILSEITPPYAKAFQTVCSLMCVVLMEDEEGEIVRQSVVPIVPDKTEYLHEHGINFHILTELDMLGLITLNTSASYIFTIEKEQYPKLHLLYGENEVLITNYKDKGFPVGEVKLTEAGVAIAKFVEFRNIPGHFEAVCDYLTEHHAELTFVD